MKIQRRINHTGRKRIDKSKVDILLEDKQQFSVAVDFTGLDLPDEAPVYLEAYQRYALQRFYFGTVGNFTSPEDTRLTELDGDMPIQFRVKVVDTAGPEGRLLAAVKGVRASNEQPDAEGHEKLLPVASRDMEDITWRVNIQSDSLPELALNSRIPGSIDRIQRDPTFQALIFPGAVRTILTWIYWNEMIVDDQEDWVTRWLTFAGSIAGEPPQIDDDQSEVFSWIEDVVAAFSKRHSLCARLAEQLGRESA